MIKLNRIRNIFALTILLSPLFGSCAEEIEMEAFDLESKREKNSSEWNMLHYRNIINGVISLYDLPTKEDEEYLGQLAYNDRKTNGSAGIAMVLCSTNYHFVDPVKVSSEEKLRNCFKTTADMLSDKIPSGDLKPKFSFLVAGNKNDPDLYIASAGGRVMVMRNGEIIFNTKDRGELSNPIIHRQSIKEGDIAFSVNEEFDESDDAIVTMFSDADDFSNLLYKLCVKSVGYESKALVMKFVKQRLVRRLRSKSE